MQPPTVPLVSIPSRGFWFFEEEDRAGQSAQTECPQVSIPSRGFWFFEDEGYIEDIGTKETRFQSPRGDFGFLKPAGTDCVAAT